MKMYTVLVCLVHFYFVMIAMNVKQDQVAMNKETLQSLQSRYMWSFLILVPIYVKAIGLYDAITLNF